MDRPVRIRHAKPAEFPGVLRCLSEAFEPYRAAYTTLAFLDTVLSPEALFERSRSMTILVALTDDDELVGTVACSAGDAARGHIRGMAVRPAWQGLGIAKALLDEAVEALRLRQCTTVTLDTTLPLRRAIGFYAVARQLKQKLVTSDRPLLAAFPHDTVALDAFGVDVADL